MKIDEYLADFTGDTILVAVNNKYNWTYVLWSLLSEKIPKDITQSDNENYLKILSTTKIHLNKNERPKVNNAGFKWKNIVRPLYKRMKRYEAADYSKKKEVGR